MGWRRSATFLFAGLFTGLHPAGAQVEASIDFGAGSIDYDDAPAFYVYNISPRVSYTRGVAHVVGTATFSRFESEGWGTRILSAASVLTPTYRGFRGELSARGESNANRVTTAGRELVAQARIHYAGLKKGVWIGSAAARVWNGTFWQSVVREDAGAWLQVRDFGARATVIRSSYELRNLESGSYVHAEGAVRLKRGSLELDASVGRRFDEGFADVLTWSLGANFWLNRRVGLVAGAGKYARDPAQALPGGNYVTFGMRLAPLIIATPPRVSSSHPRSRSRPVRVITGGDGVSIIRLVGPVAGTVELTGSFTDWRPVRMMQVAPGVWEMRTRVPGGSYLFNVRVDGGEWVVPEGVASVDDDFNGRVGRILITP